MTSTVDGLISGLSTSSLIAQLMQIESAPQARLKTKVSGEKTVIGSLQSINTRLAALETAADALKKTSTWSAVKAASSSTALSASAASGAATGSVTLDVVSLARAQVSTAVLTNSGTVSTGDTITIAVGGIPADVDVHNDRSAQGVADAINMSNVGVRAAVVTTSTGDTLLQLTATRTGTAAAFTVTGLVDPVQTAITANDAQLQVGTPGAGGYTVSSSTNTFTNLISGATLTANRLETGVTVTISADANAIADKVSALVDAANAVLSQIDSQAGFNATTNTAGVLQGNFTVRTLGSDVLSAVGNGLTGYGSFQQFGVELDSSGALTFDREAFLSAYSADPTSVETGVSGLATAVGSVADQGQDTLTATIQNHDTTVRTLNTQIDDWDVRLATRQATLQRQFATLEVALGKLQDQSSWLAGQIAGLPTYGS